MLDTLMASEWVVYSKPCITRTETVVDYLGRYSHRIALSDGRLLAFANGRVDLAYKDYRDGKKKVMQLDGEELLRRFLLHVLPKGFMRIRHFGFLANRCRAQRLGQIREAIAAQAQVSVSEAPERAAAGDVPRRCPRCRIGHLRVVSELPPRPKARAPARRVEPHYPSCLGPRPSVHRPSRRSALALDLRLEIGINSRGKGLTIAHSEMLGCNPSTLDPLLPPAPRATTPSARSVLSDTIPFL
jgi:hypothetical protein